MRAIILGVAAIVIFSLFRVAPADAETARSAEGMVESIGVNVHLGFTDSVYADFPRVRHALLALGVDFVRDGTPTSRPEVSREYRRLAADGVKLDALIGYPGAPGATGSLDEQLKTLGRLGRRVVASIEGPNEFDLSGIPHPVRALREFVPELSRGVRARPSLAGIPILAPTLVDPKNRLRLGDISRWTNEGNMHPYPGGNMPDEEEHIVEEFALAGLNTRTQPVQATETGYTNSVRQPDRPELQLPASEHAAGVYMPRLLLEGFRRGITRTYIYELIDAQSDPSDQENVDHYGLLRNNWTPKPAYESVRNLISLLDEPGVGGGSGELSYGIEGADPSLRRLLLRGRGGAYFLVLWDAQSIWDPVAREALSAEPTPVTVAFEEPMVSTGLYRPSRSPEPTPVTVEAGRLALSIGPEVSIVRLETERAFLVRGVRDFLRGLHL